MKRILAVSLAAVVAVLVFSASAFAWGLGVHAYVAQEIGKRDGDPNVNEVYGATLGDMFNVAFDAPCGSDALADLLHVEEYAQIVERKNRGLEKWVAIGLYSHNEVDGVDMTAHVHGAVIGTTSGYVIEKAWLMKGFLEANYPSLALSTLIPGLPQEVQILFYHLSVEYAVDLLLSQAHPEVGPLLMAGASFWPETQPLPMLAQTYADDAAGCFPGGATEAAVFIGLTELMFRQVVMWEGWNLSLPAEEAMLASADYMAYTAAQYLGYLGIELDQALIDMLPDLAWLYLYLGQQISFEDWPIEVGATVNFVYQNMAAEGLVK